MMRRHRLVLFSMFATLVFAGRGITPEDYLRFEFVGAPALSPDGRTVVFPLTKIDEKQNRRRTSLWIVPSDGSAAPRMLTAEGSNASNPAFSPDGKTLAFVSARGEGAGAARPQIWLLPMAGGGEARKLTDLKNGVSTFKWSPQGDRFVVTSRTGPSDNGKSPSDVRHYTHIRYKFNDSGWFDDKRSHIFVVDAATGAAKQITDGQEWDDTDPQWSPDGKTIAFVSDRTGKAFEDSRNTDIFTIPAAGGSLTKISDHAEQDTSPRFSPDGKTIAFLGATTRVEHAKLYVAPATGGAASRRAVDNADYLMTNLQWTSNNTLVFETGDRGTFHVFTADLQSRSVKPLVMGERAVRSVSIAGSQMAYLVNDFKTLDDIYVAKADGSGERRLTTHNRELFQGLDLANVERLQYKSTDGWAIDGFLVKPVGFAEGKKYPLLLNIHGGPAGQYGVDWYHEFQVYAGKGYGVFFANPRGSTGYGEKFANGIRHNWGKMDYVDVMTGLDEAIKRNAWIDTTRLGVTGGSYGGFMTNWIVGHTNRFKAAVTLRSVVNLISDEGTRDGAYGHEESFHGNLFEAFDEYWEASPLKYAKNVKTPTLVLHSDNDLRVPLEQGEQWYRALKLFGVTTELVVFPRENHNLTRTGEPKHIVESMNWQLYWFARFILEDANAKAPDALVPNGK
jgi:dipeptidyl aminopeptidase/acylaminoacyl peptidase